MSAFARWLRAHRLSRIATVVLTFLLPLTNVVSAAIVVMTARLRLAERRHRCGDGAGGARGPCGPDERRGGRSVAGYGRTGGRGLVGRRPAGRDLLRRFGSVDLAVQALVAVALVGVVLAGLAIPDARAYWQPVLQALIQAAGLPQVDGLPAGWLGTVAALMHGVIGASLLSTLMLALMLGLWLDREAEATRTGAGKFLELRLGRVLSLAQRLRPAARRGLVSLGGGLLLVLGTGFAAQGLAVVHWTADQRGWPRIWPLALYGPLLLGAPPAGLLLLGLALAGLVDNGFEPAPAPVECGLISRPCTLVCGAPNFR